MSRIGRLPVHIPSGVKVDLQGSTVTIKGPKGEMHRTFSNQIGIALESDQLVITRQSDLPAERALHGTTRALLANMVHGVSQGFQVVLELEGVGYRAELSGKNLMLYLGYSHPIMIVPPEGIAIGADPKAKTISVEGIDKEKVGEISAEIRALRPPEPYKGKGIRYDNEIVRRKAGKAGKVGG